MVRQDLLRPLEEHAAGARRVDQLDGHLFDGGEPGRHVDRPVDGEIGPVESLTEGRLLALEGGPGLGLEVAPLGHLERRERLRQEGEGLSVSW